jgi:hypothetical protein
MGHQSIDISAYLSTLILIWSNRESGGWELSNSKASCWSSGRYRFYCVGLHKQNAWNSSLSVTKAWPPIRNILRWSKFGWINDSSRSNCPESVSDSTLEWSSTSSFVSSCAVRFWIVSLLPAVSVTSFDGSPRCSLRNRSSYYIFCTGCSRSLAIHSLVTPADSPAAVPISFASSFLWRLIIPIACRSSGDEEHFWSSAQ